MQMLPALLIAVLFSEPACVQDGSAEQVETEDAGQTRNEGRDLAKKLANPLAAMISVPMQMNFDDNIGPEEEGSLFQLNIQPVLPFTLNEDWYLISRTIVPISYQDDIPSAGTQEFGMGDILQSFFFSPAELSNGWVWGAGPVMLLPTATDDSLGTEQLAIGPTAVALKQKGPWTAGILANHLWSVAGPGDRADVNATYVEPWLSYVTSTDTTISLSAETSYDWSAEAWSVPVVFTVDQLFQIGEQYISIGAAVKYWAASPEGGPQDFGFRVQMTFLIPN
jgi:hypothetical protein